MHLLRALRFSFSGFGTSLDSLGSNESGQCAKASDLIKMGEGLDLPVMSIMTSEPWKSASDDVWRRTLRQIPTVYGRLVYLAQRRSPDSGLYEHHGLAKMFGEE
ncbi:MAG: hypothetical protein Q8L92_03395, partial [Rubrivivax sp.]|nr:hypothetical protein [Rubrivivax sp.]